MKEALIARLTADPPTSALAGDRVSWFERPRPGPGESWDDVLPALVLTTAYAERGWSHEGPTGFDLAVVQFDAWALDPDAAEALARAALAEMEGIPFTDVDGTRFHPGWMDSEREDADTIDGLTLYRASRDIRFNHQPAT